MYIHSWVKVKHHLISMENFISKENIIATSICLLFGHVIYWSFSHLRTTANLQYLVDCCGMGCKEVSANCGEDTNYWSCSFDDIGYFIENFFWKIHHWDVALYVCLSIQRMRIISTVTIPNLLWPWFLLFYAVFIVYFHSMIM